MDRLDSPWALCASDISRQQGAQQRLARLSVQIPRGAVTAIIGPNGAGKSTLLRLLGGLEPSQSGQMTLFGVSFAQLSAAQRARQLAWVTQHPPSQLPLSVRACVALGRQPHQAWFQLPSSTDQQAVDDALQAVALSHKASHRFASLSGGERQRVAIARALLAAPQILLMDEPLAALDLKRKLEILPYLERLHAELSLPIIYVSHAPDEVARLADHLVLLDQGKVVASGALNAVLSRIDLPEAFADDAGVVIQARIAAHEDDELTRLEFPGGQIFVSRHDGPVGTPVRCRIHASDVSLALAPPLQSSILNCVTASVVALAPTDTPGHVLVRLEASGEPLLARVTKRSVEKLGIRPGLMLRAQIKAVALLA